MNETQLTSEADEIADSTATSGVAIVAFLISLVGIFGLYYVQMIPIAIIAAVLGTFVLWTANRNRLNLISRIFASLAVMLGVTMASWGMFERKLQVDYDLLQARKIAELYLESLSKGELQQVEYLVGFQLESVRPGGPRQESEVERAKRRLREDPAHLEIRNRRTPPKWVYVGLEGEAMGTMGYTYKLIYRDEAQTNPPLYWVFARKDCNKFEIKDDIRWFVDSLENVASK
jgi:hypothetical protein